MKTGGEWRISAAPSVLLLTQTQFANDYDLRNLYFFDPTYHYLVPDPVYVPLQASASRLTNRLVDYLKSPPGDWLAEGATETAFPPGAKVTATLADNLATVNITGAISKAQRPRWRRSCCGRWSARARAAPRCPVGRAERERQAVPPSGSSGNPVRTCPRPSYSRPPAPAPPPPASWSTTSTARGGVRAPSAWRRGRPADRVAKIGAGYTQIAVSQDGKYLAALRGNGDLYIGPIDGPLKPQQGSGYTTLSWDPTDYLWSSTGANEQIFVFRGAGLNTRQARPIEATVTSGAAPRHRRRSPRCRSRPTVCGWR